MHPSLSAGMLDVQQIFGRAGRPQYQDTGEGKSLFPVDTA